MKLLTTTVIDGRLDVPPGTLVEGSRVTILVPDDEVGFELSEDQRRELAEAISEADRGEGVDGWQLLAEIRGT